MSSDTPVTRTPYLKYVKYVPPQPVNLHFVTDSWSRLLSGPAVHLYVGADKVLFAVPKALLCYHSEYFRVALSGNFVESCNNTVTLSKDDPEVYEYIIGWMHTEQLESDHNDAPLATSSSLCRIYFLADRLCMERLMLHVLKKLEYWWCCCHSRRCRDAPLSPELITEIWANTPETSQLRTATLNELARILVHRANDEACEYETCFLQIPGFGSSLTDAICRLKRAASVDTRPLAEIVRQIHRI